MTATMPSQCERSSLEAGPGVGWVVEQDVLSRFLIPDLFTKLDSGSLVYQAIAE